MYMVCSLMIYSGKWYVVCILYFVNVKQEKKLFSWLCAESVMVGIEMLGKYPWLENNIHCTCILT
jgi:hypothetical protein